MAATTTNDTNPLARTLGGRIRLARKSSGLTTRRLAEMCDVSQPFVSQMENGQAMPSVVTLLRLTEALGTTMQWLIDDDGSNPSPTSFIGAGDGKTYRVEDSRDGMARILVEGQSGFEALEFTAPAGEVLGPHVSHPGTDFVHVTEGGLIVELENGETFRAEAGDSLSYPAEIAHRWIVDKGSPVRFICVVVADRGQNLAGHHRSP